MVSLSYFPVVFDADKDFALALPVRQLLSGIYRIDGWSEIATLLLVSIEL